jgi:hypothetical protein
MNKRKKAWPISRTLLLILIGLLNTVFIRPEDIGSWKNYVGYACLVMALIDVTYLIKKARNQTHEK